MVHGVVHGERGDRMMRRPEKELKDPETIRAILERSEVGRMATVNEKGFPVIKPVNFLYFGNRIYLHSSRKGEKVEDIHRRSPVCFEVDTPIAYVTASKTACQADYYYRSIVVKGKATFVKDRKKKTRVLKKMMEKYQPEGDCDEVSSEILEKTAVIEISIQEMTAKENFG